MSHHRTQNAGRVEQYQYLSGDLFDMALPQQAYDLIILANVCHLFDDDHNRRLLERLATALRSTGMLAILDVIRPEREPALSRSTS